MKLKFKKRIAFFNTIAAAASTFLVFVAVYFVVFQTARKHLDDDIRKEKTDVFKYLKVENSRILMKNNPEDDEKEHARVEVNPTFLQITDASGELVFQSANLKKSHLKFDKSQDGTLFFDNEFNGERIRQGQFPVLDKNGQFLGHLNVGVSQVESALVLRNLGLTLVLAFPFLTLIFYLASSFAAERGIAPIHQLIQAAEKIDDKNIATRLPMPPRRDEIHQLATTINELLNRIEGSLHREKQITADISHELRTPLAGIRGTLEVLLRKRREPEQYETKLEQVLLETDRMNRLLEQLLQLARIESGNIKPMTEQVDLQAFMHYFLEKWQPVLDEKQVKVELKISPRTMVAADANLFEIIVGNLLSNAVKYGPPGSKIEISWDENARTLLLKDQGPGILPEHLPHIFDRFYRTDESRNAKIPGTGLGLSIAKKLAELQGHNLLAESKEGQGSTFFIQFAA